MARDTTILSPEHAPRTERDHGGNLDAAIARFGGTLPDWLDLSTGINPTPYPLPDLTADSWAVLPRKTDMARLIAAARTRYRTQADVIPVNGAQGAIQLMPWICQTPNRTGQAVVVTPTYNEHAASLRTAGWNVRDVPDTAAAKGAELAVIVSPNNPDGRAWDADALLSLAQEVDLLVVDESFADTDEDNAVSSRIETGPGNIIVLRSFGKFYGLAGLRLGFALSTGHLAQKIKDMAGPWPISGPAIEIATAALTDDLWHRDTCAQLTKDAARLDDLASKAGWRLIGGTPLFRTYETADAVAAQNCLARQHIWSRIFPYSQNWLRLGLPPQTRWTQLEAGFAAL